ncbi:MAG: hypothetical protein KKE94_13045 [Gammaproteobacteria bacterium]|nr:hypothetical protein [Gammaproteobacteria bacterium]
MLNNHSPLTDDFPKSGKGLWILFCIGVFYQAVGVVFSDTSLEIPWFPKVTLLHPERIFYLYCLMMLFALYRYYLHNQEIFLNFATEALEWSFKNSGWGKSFIRKYIFEEGCGHFVVKRNVIFDEASYSKKIVLKVESAFEAFDDENGSFAASFSFIFEPGMDLSVAFSEEVQTGNHYEIFTLSGHLWRLNQVDQYHHISQGVIAKRLRLMLFGLTIVGSFSRIGKSVQGFELVLPFFSNIFLLAYLIIS